MTRIGIIDGKPVEITWHEGELEVIDPNIDGGHWAEFAVYGVDRHGNRYEATVGGSHIPGVHDDIDWSTLDNIERIDDA